MQKIPAPWNTAEHFYIPRFDEMQPERAANV